MSPVLTRTKKRGLLIGLASLAGVGLTAVLVLEGITRYAQCVPTAVSQIIPHCPADASQRGRDLDVLRKKREELTVEEFSAATARLVVEVSPTYLGVYNGVTCGRSAVVRSDLPESARRFVKAHELEHLLQPGASESTVNWRAARREPFGMVRTVFFSLAERRRMHSSWACYLADIYLTFLEYFL